MDHSFRIDEVFSAFNAKSAANRPNRPPLKLPNRQFVGCGVGFTVTRNRVIAPGPVPSLLGYRPNSLIAGVAAS